MKKFVNNLLAQLDKLARHCRQGSYQTRKRYREGGERACVFWHEHFRLQSWKNLSGKHLVAYVIYMQEKGLAASTIKTDLAAIRFWHDRIDRSRYRLPSNDELGVDLERRRFSGTDRTWSVAEYERYRRICIECGHEDFADIALLCKKMGLRIHEVHRLDTAAVEAAHRSEDQALEVKGKGGKIRRVPVEDAEVWEVLDKWKGRVPRGHKLFVADDVPTDVAIKRAQQFLVRVRPDVQDADSDRPMTYHGLRHCYAARKYEQLVAEGKGALDAHLEVSRLLGHERPEVTDIYLASLRLEDQADKDE